MPEISKSHHVQCYAAGDPYTSYKRYFKKEWSQISTKPVGGRYVVPGSFYCLVWESKKTGMKEMWPRNGGISKRWLSPETPAIVYGPSYNNVLSTDNMINRAIIGAGNRKMTLGETLGESKSTFSMFARNTSSILGALKSLKGGNVKAAAKQLGLGTKGRHNIAGDASNKFLELQFGWRPLIEEIYNGIDVVHNGLGSPKPHGHVTGYAQESTSLLTKSADFYGVTPICTSEYGGHCKMTYEFTHPSASRAFNQLGLLNPVALGYNLTGSSFILDWFLPVGDFLEGFTATSGLNFKYGYVSYKVSHKVRVPALDPGANLGTWVSRGFTYDRAVTYRDKVSGTLPRVPDFRLPKSLDQAVTASALMLQAMHRRAR